MNSVDSTTEIPSIQRFERVGVVHLRSCLVQYGSTRWSQTEDVDLSGKGMSCRYAGKDKETGEVIRWIESDMSGVDIAPFHESFKNTVDLFNESPNYFAHLFDSWYDIGTNVMITITSVIEGELMVDYIREHRPSSDIAIQKWVRCLLEIQTLIEKHSDRICVPVLANSLLYRCEGDMLRLQYDPEMTSLSTAKNSMDLLRYLAPEIIRDGIVDPRSCVYSIGMCLTEMVTNQPVYMECTSTDDLCNKIANVEVVAPCDRRKSLLMRCARC